MIVFQLSEGGRVLIDPLEIAGVSEQRVRTRAGEKSIVEVVLRSGKTYVLDDEGGQVMEAVAQAKQAAVSPADRMASALENLGLGNIR